MRFIVKNPVSLTANPPRRLWILILALVALTPFLFFNSGGSGDVETFQRWTRILDTNGWVHGYALVAVDYPPLSLAVLWSVAKIARLLNVQVFFVFKTSLIVFLFLTSFVFWLWTRNIVLALVLHLALIHNSIALGYLDIYLAPALLASLWALSARRWTWFAVLFGVSFLVKWQPLIIFPFLALHLLAQEAHPWNLGNAKDFLLRVALPLSALVALMLLIFQAPLVNAFALALNHDILSGQALNLPWLMTYLLQLTRPEHFGGLTNGLARFLFTSDPEIVLLPKLLFLTFYALTLIPFLKRARSFESAIQFSILGFLAYYIFNTGVHENHLFLPAILSVVLFWLNRQQAPLMIFCLAMNILNPLLFVGWTGQGMAFRRIGGIDITVLFALFNLGFFLVIWTTVIFPAFAKRPENN